jgi:Copper type II ascorbate-dependent monooxygenase, C-terminal domain
MKSSPERRVSVAAPRWLALLALPAACADAAGAPDASSPTDGARACAPAEAAFVTDVRPRIARYCGACHGATPNFGATVSLLDAPTLLAVRPDGTRLVDRVAARLVDGSMPPTGMPRLPLDDANAIAGWASCGAATVPAAVGVVSSAAPLIAPTRGPAGLEALDLVARAYPVGPDVQNEYRCFVFEPDIASPRFVRRFEMVYGETRVLHHVILSRDVQRRAPATDFDCSAGGGLFPGAQYLYTWAPGQSALEFPAGGVRVSRGDRFIVQVHYNNGARLPNVRDGSGVRLLLGPTEGPEYGMFSVGSTSFALPPRASTAVPARCTVRAPTTLLAGMPHMHRLGTEFDQRVTRASGARESLVHITGWRFETQLFYNLSTTLAPGDTIDTTCTYFNPSTGTVAFGENTDDEMCQNFIYATPPPTSLYCDDGNPDRPADVAYVPGACLPTGTPVDPPLARGGWTQTATPPALTPASVPDGRWLLSGVEMLGTGGPTPIGNIDFATSYMLARGQVIVRGGELAFDASTETVVLIGRGMRFGGPTRQSFRVAFDGVTSPSVGPSLCPSSGPPVRFDWGLAGDVLTLGFTRSDVPGQTLWPRYHFRRAP